MYPAIVGSLSCNTGPNGHDAGNFACNQAVDAGHVVPVAYGIRTANTSSNGWGIQEEATHTLDGAMGIAVGFVQNQRDEVRMMHVAGALAAEPGAKQQTYVAQPAYTTKLHNTTNNQAGKVYEEYTTALDRSSPPPALLTAMQVRRLTPEECEALQGFPRGYTAVPHRGKPAADGPRYKALGNSWATPNVQWIGKRIQAVALIQQGRAAINTELEAA